jgi:hypothetical protein
VEFDQWKNLVGIVRQQDGDPAAQFNVRAYICLALVVGYYANKGIWPAKTLAERQANSPSPRLSQAEHRLWAASH